MLTKKISLILLSMVILMGITPTAKADGGMFYPRNYYMNETDQKALIYMHDGKEDLVILPYYSGSAKNFVWVVPTPNKPNVEKSSVSLFTRLQKETVVDNSGYVQPMMKLSSNLDIGTAERGIEIVEEKTIDVYSIVTLKADSETALSDWMKENEYSFPENLNYILGDYINDGWYFTISKIRPENLETASQDLYDGTITPLRFSFDSDKVIYPMKLTKMALEQSNTALYDTMQYPSNRGTAMTVYVLSDRKYTNSNLEITWANWLKKGTINNIAEETSNDWLRTDLKRLFLTKSYKYTYSVDMSDDLIFVKSEKNSVYPVPLYLDRDFTSAFWQGLGISLVVLCFSPMVLLYFILLLWQKISPLKYQKQRNVGKLLLILLTVIVPVIYYKLFFWEGSYAPKSDQGYVWGLLLAFVIVALSLITVFIGELKVARKLKIKEAANLN